MTSSNGFLTPGQIAKLIGVTKQWVSRLIERGEIKSQRIGVRGWHHIPRASFVEFVARNKLHVEWGEVEGKPIPEPRKKANAEKRAKAKLPAGAKPVAFDP